MNPVIPAGTPLIWRTPTTLQVGFSVALTDAPRGAQTALKLLDGTVGVEQAARFAEIDAAWLADTVTQLRQAGVLDRRRSGHVALVGDGPAADAVRALLSPRHRITSYDPSSRWGPPEVVVLAPEQTGPDRVLTAALVRAGIAHVVMNPIPGGMSVGPFVTPGTAPCQRCCDLTLAGRDREWPRIAVQMAASRAGADSVAVAWAAGLTAAHVETHLAGGRPQSLGCSWELCCGEQTVREWPRHPDCDCALVVA